MIKGRETFKIFESNIRLKMVAGLSKSNLTYNQLRELCNCSDGNIATHTKKLVSAGFIDVKKEFVNNKPKTTYNLTEYGQRNLRSTLILKKLLKKQRNKMRKIMFTFLLTLSMIMLINIVPTKAFDNETELDLLIRRIDHINEIYNSNYYILSEEEFINSEITDTFKSYDDYVKHLLNYDLNELENELIVNITVDSETINVNIETYFRSTSGSRTLSFYNGNNKMILKYKYSGSKFDTSYKPGVTVTKVNTKNFFGMSSHTGSFKNSNKTYSIIAKGRVITPSGVVSNKSFTVNFNL